MQYLATDINENNAAAAFTKQSLVFDQLYGKDKIIEYKRQRVRTHLSEFLRPQSHILELNCGTGEDAIWLATRDHKVHATDISNGMLEVMKEKIKTLRLQSLVSQENCSFTALDQLANRGPYDAVFSNFAGLNCTSQLEQVLSSLPPLLHSGGTITLVILPKFCLWEVILLARGKFKTAFRRFKKNGSANAKVEGLSFQCYYYNPSFIIRHLSPQFRLLSLEGLCTIMPPSFIEHFGDRYPRLFSWLKKREDQYKTSWPWKYIGDYYIITMQKK